MGTSKAKQGISSLLAIGRQTFRHFPGKEGLSMCNVFFGRQTPLPQTLPLFFFFPPAFDAEHEVIWYGISLWSDGVTCPGCVHSQFPQTACRIGEKPSKSNLHTT